MVKQNTRVPFSRQRTPSTLERRLPVYPLGMGFERADGGEQPLEAPQSGYMLVCAVEGRGFLDAGGQRLRLRPGSAALLDCGRPCRWGAEGEGWAFLWIRFDGLCAEAYVSLITAGGGPLLEESGADTILLQADALRRHFGIDHARSSLEASMTLLQLLTFLALGRLGKTPGNGPSRLWIREIAASMASIPEQACSVDELARQAHLSKGHFIRTFKAELGTTPYAYLMNIRMAKAREMLKNTHAPVNEIAKLLGFRDARNFSAAFKKATGVTAGEYRRGQAEGQV